jgi:hypothetical protein
MKLYYDCGAWTVPGKQSRQADRVAVPGTPGDLAAWLNERAVPLLPFSTMAEAFSHGDEQLQLASEPTDLEPQLASEPPRPKVAGHCDACGLSTASALTLQKGNEIDTIIEWAAEAPDWAVARLAERIVELSAEIEGSTRQ